MKEINKEITVELNNELNAKIIIERDGQNTNKSDDICVICDVCLPKSSSEFLHDSIIYEGRLEVCDEYLGRSWGRTKIGYDNNKWRYSRKYFFGQKWSKVFVEAEVWAENEIMKLVYALDERKSLLENAED